MPDLILFKHNYCGHKFYREPSFDYVGICRICGNPFDISNVTAIGDFEKSKGVEFYEERIEDTDNTIRHNPTPDLRLLPEGNRGISDHVELGS